MPAEIEIREFTGKAFRDLAAPQLRGFLWQNDRLQWTTFGESKKFFRIGPDPVGVNISDDDQKDIIRQVSTPIIAENIGVR